MDDPGEERLALLEQLALTAAGFRGEPTELSALARDLGSQIARLQQAGLAPELVDALWTLQGPVELASAVHDRSPAELTAVDLDDARRAMLGVLRLIRGVTAPGNGSAAG